VRRRRRRICHGRWRCPFLFLPRFLPPSLVLDLKARHRPKRRKRRRTRRRRNGGRRRRRRRRGRAFRGWHLDLGGRSHTG
jgi:hypothetical protein